MVVDKYVKLNKVEAKFQLSFKVKLAQDILFGKSDLWLAYTQKSFWQIYNDEFSRPFRETNYEPEVILNFPAKFKVFGLEGKMLGFLLTINPMAEQRPLPEVGIESLVLLPLKKKIGV